MLPNRPAQPPSPTPQIPINQGPPPSVGSPMKDEPEKDEIKQQLTMLMNQAKKLADQNGIDFQEIVSAVAGNTVSSDRPRPMSTPVGAPSMGG